MRLLAAWLSWLALGLLAACSHAPGARPTAAEDIAALTTQAHRWDRAIVAKDRAGIEANMAEDFRQIDGAGNVEDKASFVQDLVSAQLVIQPYTVEDFEVRLYGDVALISGRTRMSGSYAGKPFSTHYRYIDVYVRRAGVWQIVSVQISKLPS
jgi:ketosteroid isomerase-like protein